MRYLIELAPAISAVLNVTSAMISAAASRPRRRPRQHLGCETRLTDEARPPGCRGIYTKVRLARART
jgi:hypothetical protein